jgi:hypothetical protein
MPEADARYIVHAIQILNSDSGGSCCRPWCGQWASYFFLITRVAFPANS